MHKFYFSMILITILDNQCLYSGPMTSDFYSSDFNRRLYEQKKLDWAGLQFGEYKLEYPPICSTRLFTQIWKTYAHIYVAHFYIRERPEHDISNRALRLSDAVPAAQEISVAI